MKVLVLVMSARRQPWGKLMDVSMETWDKEDNPQTQTLYYCGKSDQPSTDKIFYSPALDEELVRVSARTIEAFEKSLELDWDFMARPNSSTYVHKRNLIEFIETLPTDNVLCGLLTTGDRPFLWGGGSYIMSRDVIERIVANKHLWNFGIMEDGSITDIANELEIPFSPGRMASINLQPNGSYLIMVYGYGDNFESNDWADLKKIEGHHYFRCKYDPDRSVDLKIMRNLKQFLS